MGGGNKVKQKTQQLANNLDNKTRPDESSLFPKYSVAWSWQDLPVL